MTAVCQEHRSNPLTWTFLRWVNSTASKLENILSINGPWTITRNQDFTKCESSSSRAWPRTPAAMRKWQSVRPRISRAFLNLLHFYLLCSRCLPFSRANDAAMLTSLRRPWRGSRAQARPGSSAGGAGHGHRRAGRDLETLPAWAADPAAPGRPILSAAAPSRLS